MTKLTKMQAMTKYELVAMPCCKSLEGNIENNDVLELQCVRFLFQQPSLIIHKVSSGLPESPSHHAILSSDVLISRTGGLV